MKPYKKNLISIMLIVILVFNYSIAAAAAPKALTLKQAVASAVSTSYNIQKLKNELKLKNIELTQAIQAIKDIRKKENTIKFSLLFNIKWPEKHALPKEIELVMKVPKVQSDIKDLERKIEDTRLKTVMEAETGYYNVIELMTLCSSLESTIASEKSTYSRLSKDFLLGKANKDDLKEVKSSIEKNEKDYQSNLIRYENAKSKLSDIIGVDVKNGYTFDSKLSELQLQRSQLNSFIEYALNNDYAVYQAELVKKLADVEVETLRSIYNNRWGSMVSVIDADIKKGGQMDFNAFLDKYNTALQNIEEPYTGAYKIRILFITISIPKEWFRSEYSGIRYFEDQKYALYTSLMERYAAQKDEQQARKDLTTEVSDGLNTLMELWSAYQDTLKQIDTAKADYERIKKLNIMGEAQFMDVESAKNNVLSCENAAFTALISYNKSLSGFDYSTSGAISKLKSGSSISEGSSYESGISWLSDDGSSNKPSWYLENYIEEYKFKFGIILPDESKIKATHYELCTEDGKLIGTRTAIDKTITHMPLAYEGTTKLIVKLYNQNTLTATSEIDAAEYRGTLDLKPAEAAAASNTDQLESGSLIGKWKLLQSDNDKISRFVPEFDPQYKIGFYQLETFSGAVIGSPKVPVGSPVSHLTLVFSNPQDLTLKLFGSTGESLGEAYVISDMDVKIIKVK